MLRNGRKKEREAKGKNEQIIVKKGGIKVTVYMCECECMCSQTI